MNIAIIFGGRSSEHEVSIVSARSVFQALDYKKYLPTLILITKRGQWITGPASQLLTGRSIIHGKEVVLGAGRPGQARLFPVRKTSFAHKPIDVVFPVLHGPFGEDGAIQGLLEMADVPYVGCGVVGSALGMDKALQKVIFSNLRLPIVDYQVVRDSDWRYKSRSHILRTAASLGLPLFVKPVNMGSSIGITKVFSSQDLPGAINTALRFDRKAILEAAVPKARELECAVLGNDRPISSGVGEIAPGNDFYDYNAKYVDGNSQLMIPANISSALRDRIREMSLVAYRGVDCSGLARVDFLLSGRQIILNEINTMPGFTAISMYPKLWLEQGIPYGQLVDRLIRLAFDIFAQRKRISTPFQPPRSWYRTKK